METVRRRVVRLLLVWISGGLVPFLVQGETKEKRVQNPEKPLLLRDFKPVSMLHVPVHNVSRAKFSAIDIHNHVNDVYTRGNEYQDPRKLVEMMDRMNVRQIVILTGGWGDRLQKVLDEMVRPFPDRFVVFTQLDWSRINEPNFGESMAAQVRDAVTRGARGLKILKDLGLEIRDRSCKLVAVDDARLDPVWAECRKLGIPVAIHVTDPEAFFRPLDAFNERYEELVRHPDWSFCCPPKFPTKESIMDARNRVFAKHSNTTFISLHVGNWPEDLNYVEGVLNRYPNVVVELGARQAELGRQPRRARDFFLKNSDRILFGTDATPGQEMYQNYFRWLETADEYFDYWGYPGQGRWEIYGLDLPDTVLEKIYRGNAERIFSQFRGMSSK